MNKFCKYRSLVLYLRALDMSMSLHGRYFDTNLVLDLFEYQCLDCRSLLKLLGNTFFVENILFDAYLPEFDKKKWIECCCQIMLMFASIRNYFGKNAVIKCCKFLVEECFHESFYFLRYWSCQTIMGHNHYAMEYYFRQAMKINYIQTVQQWSEVE